MISNHLLFKENAKKNIGLIIISFIMFFLSLVLPTIMLYTNYVSEKNANIHNLNFYERFGDSLNQPIHMASLGILILFAVIVAIYSFSYLHNRKQIDFYHSLPIKRRTLFLHNYTLGILCVLASYLINILIFILICFSLNITESLNIAYTIKATIWNSVFYLVFYSIFVLSTILTGNKIISFLLGSFFVNISLIFSGLISILGGLIITSSGYSIFSQNFIIKSFLGSPLISSISFYNKYIFLDYPLYELSNTKFLIIYFIFTVILSFVCYILFLARKSEKSNVCIAFEWLKSPLKYLGVIIGALYIGFFFKIISSNQNIWLIFGTVLGAIFLHCITEIIYEFDFKAIFKNWKGIIWCSIISLAISLTAISSFLPKFLEKFEKVPNLEKVVTVDIDSYLTYYNYENILKDEENIKNVIKLYEISKNNNNENENNSYFSTKIGYKLKNGAIKYLSIYLKETEEVFSILKNILYNEETILKRNRLFSDKIYFENLEIVISNNANKEARITNLEDMKTFTEILKKDILANAKKEKGDLLYTAYINGEQSIFSSYSETLKFLAEKINIKPEDINLEQVDRIRLSFDNHNQIEDKEILQYLLENSKPLPEYENFLEPYKIRTYINNRGYNYRYIPKENINSVKNYLKEKGIE